jgi:hypothetical protein
MKTGTNLGPKKEPRMTQIKTDYQGFDAKIDTLRDPEGQVSAQGASKKAVKQGSLKLPEK